MRICKQCNSEMIEGFNVKMDGAGYGIKIVKTDEVIIPISIGKIKACICPKCGEVSLYIDNFKYSECDRYNLKIIVEKESKSYNHVSGILGAKCFVL